MMRHPEHHHHYQRNSSYWGVKQKFSSMPPPRPPPQRMLVSVPGAPHPHPHPHPGVLVSVPQPPPPPAPQMISALPPPPQHPTVVVNKPPQQQQQPVQPVYYEPMASGDSETQPAEEQAQPGAATPNTTTSSNVPNLANMKEKTPMCLVNELARYNKIQHQYKLTGEQGPAHKKAFTVTLKLGNEEYEAEGASIKKAQHSAAALALEKTQLRRPPPKTARILKPGAGGGGMRANGGGGPGMVTPTVELNALAMKRGERTVYIVENGMQQPVVPPPPLAHHQHQQQPQGYVVPYYNRHNMYPPGGHQPPPRFSYDARRGHGMRGHYHQYDNRYHNQYGKPGGGSAYPSSGGEMCAVRLKVGEREYPGTGPTIQAARHDAATRAIEEIKRLNEEEEQAAAAAALPNAIVDDDEDADRSALNDLNSELKSPISLVHEIALKRHLNVVFEVKSENGPPHMKVFVTLCKIGEAVVEGEGHGKKISKKRAAEKMLQKLAQLPPLPAAPINPQLKRKRITNKKKTRNLVKVTTDKPSDGVEEINPISRLIQIQQANKEKEPVYAVIEERGAARRREFVIQASVNGVVATGVGPNKKMAKRAAAQALLTQLGFAVTVTTNGKEPLAKVEKVDSAEKARKVTFMEEKVDGVQSIGGTGGRQLVPGLLIVGDQTAHSKPKTSETNANSFNNETTTTTATTTTASTPPKPKVTPQKITPPPVGGVRSKDKLMYLVQLMNIQAQFSDFPKANHEMYLTLVSLTTNPPQVCHGEGPTIEASHEKAALEALNVLSEMGLDNIVPSKQESNNTDA